jgi:hypothetical protein
MDLYMGWIWGSILGWISIPTISLDMGLFLGWLSIPAFSMNIWVSTWAVYGGPSWAGYLSLHLVWIHGSLPGLDMGVHPGLDIFPCI